MSGLIEIESLSFAYYVDYVLEDINLEIQSGDFIGMIGPNGGGKTTLLRLILGILTPTRGSIRIMGKSPKQTQDLIAYVPQYADMDHQFPIKVREVVAMGLIHKYSFLPWFAGRQWEAVNNALQKVSLLDLADKRFGDLSGGQRQRCLIARAIVSKPRIILLDEPTASVDFTVESDIFEFFRSLNQEGITIILVSHDVGFISSYVNRVVCVNRRIQCHNIDEVGYESDLVNIYSSKVTQIRHQCRL